MAAKKKCPECDEPILGRVDKKFCSDACRNNYNNKLKSEDQNLVRNINNALRKNRRILEELNPGGKTTAHKSKLVEKGFNFKYHTSIYVTRKGEQYHFCYEQGYLKLENDFYIIVKNNK